MTFPGMCVCYQCHTGSVGKWSNMREIGHFPPAWSGHQSIRDTALRKNTAWMVGEGKQAWITWVGGRGVESDLL